MPLSPTHCCAAFRSTIRWTHLWALHGCQLQASDSFAGGEAVWDPECCPASAALKCPSCDDKLSLLLQINTNTDRLCRSLYVLACLRSRCQVFVCTVFALCSCHDSRPTSTSSRMCLTGRECQARGGASARNAAGPLTRAPLSLQRRNSTAPTRRKWRPHYLLRTHGVWATTLAGAMQMTGAWG